MTSSREATDAITGRRLSGLRNKGGGTGLSPTPRRTVLAAAVGGLLAFSGSAHAQLEEIVVTAERRATTLQDTPISIMAFTGDTLEFKGVRDMRELANIAPNLDIKGSRGTGDTSPTYQIRGISGGGGATGERVVGFYVDNVFMPRTTGPVMRVLDVERVEVLRGPQGTLFGRNSTAGAIRVFSKQPHDEQDGYVRLTGGNFDHYDVSAMLNVPITDQLFFRGQAAYLHQDGYVRRGPQMLGDSEDRVLRLQAAWHPSDQVNVTFGLLYTDSESTGSPTDMVRFNMDPACPFDDSNPFVCWQGNYADWMSDYLEQHGQERLRSNDPRLLLDDYTMPDFCFLNGPDPAWDDMCLQWNENEYTQFDVNVNWEISDRLSMSSTTGFSDFSSDGVSDWQLLGMEHRRARVESSVAYQEFQFNLSFADGRVDFITGANYFRETSESPRDALLAATGSSTFNAVTGGNANGDLWGCFAANGFCANEAPRLQRTGDGYTWQRAVAYGVFATSTVRFTERVNLTLGLRQSFDTKDLVSTLFASDNFIPEDGVSTTVVAKDDWDELDWRATVDIRATDDIMMYVTGSKAFRAGSFNVGAPFCVPAVGPGQPCPTFHDRPPPAPIPHETLVNYEFGMRTEWLDGRLRLNGTYFDMDYTDRQGASAVADPTAPTGFVIELTNQGDVDLSGLEIEAMFAVTDRFTLDASAGRVKYTMEDPCINNGLFLFPPPIERSFTLGGRYVIPAQRGNFSVGLNYARVGPQETHAGGLTPEQNAAFGCESTLPTLFVDSRYRLDGYGLLNGVLRYSSDDGRWSASLYGNNLTDEVYANNAQAFGRGFWTQGGPGGGAGISAPPRNAIAEYRGRPREYGLTFQLNFF